ncbi:hypothetical protein LINPERPRIM_LOCUS7535, partial [Linum perenne]
SANLNICSVTRAELHTIVEGIELAWSLGIQQLEGNVDSICAVRILCNTTMTEHQRARLVTHFQRLRGRLGDSGDPHLPQG